MQSNLAPISLGTKLVPALNLGDDPPTDGRHINDNGWTFRTNTQDMTKQTNGDDQFIHGPHGKVIGPKEEDGSITKGGGAKNIPIKKQEQINGTNQNKSDKVPRGSLSTMQGTPQHIPNNDLTKYNDHRVTVSTPSKVLNSDSAYPHLNSQIGEATDEHSTYKQRPNIRSDTVNANGQTASLHIGTKTGTNESPTAGSLTSKREKTGLTTNPSIRTEKAMTSISGFRPKTGKREHHGTSSTASPKSRIVTEISHTLDSNPFPTGHLENRADQGFSSNENSKKRIGPNEDTATYGSSSLKRNIHMGIEVTQASISTSLSPNQVRKDVGQRRTSNPNHTIRRPTDGSQELTSKSVVDDKTEGAVKPGFTNNAHTSIRRTSEISTKRPFRQTSTNTISSLPTTEAICPLWPEHKLRPPPTRVMTKGVCEQNPHYTFLPTTSMCIRYVRKTYTWLEARTRCWKDSGDLVLIDSQEKRDDCHNFLRKNGKLSKWSTKRYWIGLQIAPCGIKWVDGSPFRFNWVKRHPTHIACGCVVAGPFGQVMRRHCKTSVKSVICERV